MYVFFFQVHIISGLPLQDFMTTKTADKTELDWPVLVVRFTVTLPVLIDRGRQDRVSCRSEGGGEEGEERRDDETRGALTHVNTHVSSQATSLFQTENLCVHVLTIHGLIYTCHWQIDRIAGGFQNSTHVYTTLSVPVAKTRTLVSTTQHAYCTVYKWQLCMLNTITHVNTHWCGVVDIHVHVIVNQFLRPIRKWSLKCS